MSNIVKTKNGLVEKSSERKIESPLDRLPYVLIMPIDDFFNGKHEILGRARVQAHRKLYDKYNSPDEGSESWYPRLLSFRLWLKTYFQSFLKRFRKRY